MRCGIGEDQSDSFQSYFLFGLGVDICVGIGHRVLHRSICLRVYRFRRCFCFRILGPGVGRYGLA